MAQMGYSSAISYAIREERRRDPTIFRYSWGMPSQADVDEFGWERVPYSGICETQEAGAGIGACAGGNAPYCQPLDDELRRRRVGTACRSSIQCSLPIGK